MVSKNFAVNTRKFKHAHRRFLSATALTAAGFVAIASPALAQNWTDHQAVVGNISIDTSVPDTTNITQHTDFVKVQGNGDINAGWTVNVAQPSSSSKYVLYDTKDDPTRIMGALNANGEIYIFDQNGVIFGQSSRVDVGSLVATTGHIADSDLLDNDGKLTILGANQGAIDLQGAISVRDAGLAGFVAPTVTNSGVIAARLGKVALASGEKVTLDLYGDNLIEIAVNDQISGSLIDNSGSITAEGGTIALQAAAARDVVDSTINMSGIVNASSATVKGGKIILGGGTVKVSGKADASGKNGGGKIDVKGRNVYVADTAVLQSDAHANGNGGAIDVIAQDHADFRGTILARGGANGGNGGNAEVSGYKVLGYQGYADLRAANGTMGTLLLDPEFAVIHSGLLHNPLGLGVVISAQALANSMRTSSVEVEADDFIDVGTKKGSYNISTGNAILDAIVNAGLNALPDGNINLGTYNVIESQIIGYFFGFPIYGPVLVSGTTAGSLTLRADTVNFNRNLTMGNGNVAIDGNTVNLDSKIFALNGTTLLDDSRLSSNAGTVNVLSNNASIQQGIDLANDAGGADVNVAAGTYQEQLVIKKNLNLNGAGVNDTILLSPTLLNFSYNQDFRDNYAIVRVEDAANVNISGFQIDGSTDAGAGYTDNSRFLGVVYRNAGGTFSDNWVRNITTPGNSTRSGFAFLANAKVTPSVLRVENNTFDNFQQYAIAVADKHLDATVSGNTINGNKDTQPNSQTGIYTIAGAKVTATGNTIKDVDYGVEVIRSLGGTYASNILENVDNGFYITGSGLTALSGNTITAASGTTGTGVILESSNKSSLSGDTINGFGEGVSVQGSNFIVVDGTTIANNGVGIHTKGGNGLVTLTGNILTDNATGALFESGEIDLSGLTNEINGGTTGFVFDPGAFTAAGLSLTGNTVGTTVFAGQTGSYIELFNDALFQPGAPTNIDATNARFDGVSASDDPSLILSTADYNAINNKLRHFPNDNNVGLIFFGLLPPTAQGATGIQQEDLFSFYNLLNLQTANLNITINGLPFIPGAGAPRVTAPRIASFNPADLNAITPAAGGDTQQTSPNELNRIDTQAGGGEEQEASCWDDAINLAQSGQSVNISYGTSFEDTLNGAASCGGGAI